MNAFGNPWKELKTKDYLHGFGDGTESKITFVLNNEPSLVKTFNTLNYEGTQAFIERPLINNADFVTINNSEAYYAGTDIQGWECKEIKSDLGLGTILDFIEKEGKWFNYIKGKWTVAEILHHDTARFSVQGIGVVNSSYSLN